MGTPVAATRSHYNDWIKVGVNPYTGTTAEALKELGYSTELQAKFLDAIESRRGLSVKMPDDVVYRKQIFSVGGKHKVWGNVRQKLGKTLDGVLYRVEHAGAFHFLFYPPKDDGGCDNWSIMDTAEAAKGVPIS